MQQVGAAVDYWYNIREVVSESKRSNYKLPETLNYGKNYILQVS